MQKTVCFAGHKLNVNNCGIEEKLTLVVEDLINEGYTNFFDGNKGDFDDKSANVVLKLKKRYPHIKLIKVLTYYHPNKVYETQSCYDDEVFPDIELYHPKLKITKRNEWIVENSDVVVCHIVNKFRSGAYTMVKYAQKLKKRIIYI